MGDPWSDTREDHMEIDLARVVALALEEKPATADEARAAVQRAVDKLYPGLEDAGVVVEAVWKLAQTLAQKHGRDVISQLREMASGQAVVRLSHSEVAFQQLDTGSFTGPHPRDEKLLSALRAGRLVDGGGGGQRIWYAAWFVGGVLVGAALLALAVWMVFLR